MIGARAIWRDWALALSWFLAMILMWWSDLAPVPVRIAASAQLGPVDLPSPPITPGVAHRDQEMTSEQAARMLQVRYGTAAKVVRTDVLEQDGHRVYVFRLLSVDGRIWIVHIDARNGSEVP